MYSLQYVKIKMIRFTKKKITNLYRIISIYVH